MQPTIDVHWLREDIMTAPGPAAAPALLVRDFVNTLDVQSADDRLHSPAALAQWLREHGLTTGRSATEADLTDAVALREGLRAELREHHDRAGSTPGPRDIGRRQLDRILAGYPLRLGIRTGTPQVEPAGTGTSAGLAGIVAAVAESHADLSWPRLKVCQEPSCQWAFVDTSRNQSRCWCSMRLCGNRAKIKAYRARQD
jgi:predicted RNA-binding Zn ribbon-like protein